jgi:hypothetical protein
MMRGDETTDPINFPNPTVSLSDGRKSFKGYENKTFASQGNAPRATIKGSISSDIWIKEEMSSSASRSPKDFPKAISEITSRVKNSVFSAKSTGLYSVLVEIYFDSNSRMSFATLLSTDCSRASFSFPEYLVL